MKRAAKLAAISVGLTLMLGACNRTTAPGPNVWATVNGKDITREEVEKYYRNVAQSDAQQTNPSPEEANSLKLNILDELINNEILLERARKMGLEAGDGEVEDKFTERKSPFTEDEFQRQLKDRGMTVDDVKRELRRQLSIQKLMNREVNAKVSITDADIKEFYEKNRAQFNVPEQQYRLAQITVTAQRDPNLRNRKNDDASTDADAKRKAGALLQRIRDGADFTQVAMDYSEDPASAANGGDLGYVPESSLNQMPADLKRVVAGLRPGDVSNVLVMGGTYRILKMLAREAPGQRDLNDPQVQQMIREGLKNRKEQLLRAAYMSVARNESKISNYLARQVIESSGKLPTPEPAPAAKQ